MLLSGVEARDFRPSSGGPSGEFEFSQIVGHWRGESRTELMKSENNKLRVVFGCLLRV